MRGRNSNLQGFRQEKWFHIYRVVNSYRIAILAIQEAHLTDELAASINSSFETKVAVHHSPLPETRNAAGVAFVINKGLLNTEDVSCEEIIPGRAILARVKWHSNTTIKILNVYAPNDAADNGTFWEKLNDITRRRPETKPDVMLGDFNMVEDSLDRLPCHPDNPNTVATLGELKCNLNLIDGWRRTFPDKREYSHTQTTNTSQSRIDRIYLKNELLAPATGWRIDPPLIETDHWLVSATISTPEAPEIGRGRWQIPTYLLKNKDVVKEINDLGKKAQHQIEASRFRRTITNNPQTIYAKFKSDLIEICRTHAKVIHPTITNKIEKLKRKLNEVNNNTQIDDDDKLLESIVIKTEILELERILFESNRAYSKTKHHVHAETICRDWIRTNRLKKPRDVIYSLYNPLEEDQTTTHDSRDMADAARRYHQNLQNRDRDPTTPPDATKLEAILNNVTTQITPAQKDDLAKYLKQSQVRSALSEQANNKAAGLDGIPIELWKNMNLNFDDTSDQPANPNCDIVTMLTRVFNDIEKYGIDPSTRFNEGWMCPIYKKGDRNNVANYRPITVLNTDYKTMTKALANKLADAAPTIIHRDQAGFIKNRSIFDQVKLAKLMIDYGNIAKKNGAIVALDQEKAYDKILHPYLWAVLERFGLPQHFINTVKYLYQGAKTSILINGILSTPYDVNRGVRQGDGLSCLLFDIGIEPLASMIRNSPIQGISVRDAPENIKCKLFANDMMVYLNETDDLRTLEDHALKPWCEVSGAKFNISKTEIIPIGTKPYRDNLILTRRTNPTSEPVDPNIKIAVEGQPVRVLGAWIGNGVDQATPWTPTIEKIATSLKRWEANHPTSEGRRLISQMIIGGMTQYLAKVQGMPETTIKTLEKLIRNFAWSGKNKPTISMAHMSAGMEAGGKKVLDIQARNEAIQLTWIQSYLKMDEARPTWAYLADEIFRNDVPGERTSLLNTPHARINQFLQTWQSRVNKKRKTDENEDDPNTQSIPRDLREMIKIAKKYGVKLEAVHPAPETRLELPAIRNVHTKTSEKPDTLTDKFGKCIRNTHQVKSLQDITEIANNVPNNHKRNKKCKCTRCTELRRNTNGACKHPNKCIERAKNLLGTINDKWNPTILHPPEFFTNPKPNETGQSQEEDDENPEKKPITLDPFNVETSLKDCFRVFTNPSQQLSEITLRAPRRATTENSPTIVYTDGSCIRNGESTAQAGSRIWFEDNDPRNESLRVPGPNQSNQVGELYAILQVMRKSPVDKSLIIKTDSKYAILGLSTHLKKWENQGWMYQEHAPLFKAITSWARYRSNTTKLVWVKGHNGIKGNEEADKLAGEGALKDPPATEMNLSHPAENIPSGAKLSALTQKDFYRGIKKHNPPPPRRSSDLNLGRIQACAEEYYDNSPTFESIWKATKHKDLTKKTREFLWKATHNAFKIGKFWDNIPNHEQRGTCTHCDTTESMEHILTECTAPGREQVWALTNSLLTKRTLIRAPTNYGALLGCCLTNFRKENGKPDEGLNRLFRILISESMYVIWKIRCKRIITWNNDPNKTHSPHEIHNKWLQAINTRLKIDSIHTNTKIFQKKAIKTSVVLKTWKKCLKDELHETRNWCGKTGVLVGIAPKRPPGRNR